MTQNDKVQIHIVPSFHYDVAYLKTQEEYMHHCFDNIHEVLNIMDQYPEYHFTLEQVILVKQYWQRFPDKREKLRKHIKEGRLCLAPGMHAMPDMNLPDGESMFMQVKVGKDWLKETFDVNPTACYIADCWGHPAQLPQIMTQAGYDYYVFWRCMRRDVMTNDFIWSGLDGTKIKTHWLARGYGGITSPEIAQKINVLDIDFSGITIDDIIELCEEIREYGDQNVVMLFNGGDFAYPDITVPKTISKYQDDQYKIQFSTVEKHMQSVDWDKTKIYGGEFNTAQQGTFTTNIIIKQTIRELVNHIHALERLAVLSGRSDIDTLAMWENLLKQQFHDIICGSMCDGGVQDTYTEMREARKLIYAEMEKIEDKHGKLAYFNAMDISRSEIIQKDCLKYKIDISPFGFVSVNQARILKETEKQSLPCVFENEYYEAVIDASGYISTLKDKVTGENLTQGLEIPFGGISMQMDYGDPWLNFNGPISGGSVESSLTQNSRDPYYRGTKDDFVDRRTFPSTQVTARVIEQNEEELIIEQQSLMQFWEIEFPITTIITLSKSSTLIQYKTSFVPHGKNYRMRVAFPTSIDDGVIRHEIAFGIQERDQAEYPVQNWIDYADNNKGLALINRGIPANNVDEGIMMLTLFRSVAMEYKTDSLLSYNIGIPQCFEYAIMPHSTDNDINIIQNAIAFNQPLRLCQVSSECIKENTNYTTDKDNVIVSGLRYQDKSIFVRVYEAIGKEKTTCNIKIPEDIKSYCIADGLQNAIGEKTACSYTINIQMRAFEIANILLYKE